MKEYRCAAYTFTGRRTRNQDNFLLNGTILEAKHGNESASISGQLTGPVFLAVVDGAGTKTTGETASRLICEQLWNQYEKFDEVNEISEIAPLINEALVTSNSEIEAIMETEPTSKMGGTAAVLLIYNGKILFGNVGDSAVYLRRDGKVTKLTRDHTEGEELLARGALTEDMLKMHAAKMRVTRRIGYMTFGKTDIMEFYEVGEVHDGDIFILGSPGVVQYIYPNDINNSLQSGVDVAKCAERVVKCAMDHESKDNATAIVVRVNDIVDKIGNSKGGSKPFRAKSVHVHTSIDIDPHIIKIGIYVSIIIAILGFSLFYIISAYPRDKMITYVNQSGAAWYDPNDPNADVQTPTDNTDKSGSTSEPPAPSDDVQKSDEAQSTGAPEIADSGDTAKSDATASDTAASETTKN